MQKIPGLALGKSRLGLVAIFAGFITLGLGGCVGNSSIPRAEDFSGSPVRTLKEVKFVFDRDSRRFYALFGRNSEARGTAVFAFVIRPDGTLTASQVVSSSFSKEFTEKLLALVATEKFEARPIQPFLVKQWPIIYMPN